MKKIFGFGILAVVFAFLIGTTCAVCGWKAGLTVWGIAIAVALIICFAMFLITEGE